jgi:ParB-like nuclease domain
MHRVALEQIRVPDNVRALADAHVHALAGAIRLQGMLVPLAVRANGAEFEVVAGFNRRTSCLGTWDMTAACARGISNSTAAGPIRSCRAVAHRRTR